MAITICGKYMKATIEDIKRRNPLMRFFARIRHLLSTLALVVSTSAVAMPQFNLSPGVTPISRDMYYLHMTIFWICVVIGVIVFSIMFYSLARHRKSLGVKPATFHENTFLEIFWAVIPFLILIVMAFPATKILMNMNDDAD